ncbi:MAG TPA: hypothetical protein ENI90_06690 [Methylothermaceae bacterium]|nr:hypothetical protein [Methylothermaceae bacterium]
MKAAKVAVLGAPPRFEKLLIRFLTTGCQAQVVEAAHADVCIIDLDGPGAGELLEGQRRHHPDRPLILLSLHEVERDDAICLKKPLQPEALAAALKQTVAKQSGSQPQKHTATQGKEGKTTSLPGDVATSVKYYNPRHYLQELLATAYRQALSTDVTLRIELGWEPIVIYPRQRLVWVNADDRKLRAFCRLSLTRIASLADGDDTETVIRPDPEAALQAAPESSQRMDALLWKVAWWNAAGRLPSHIRADRPLQLKRWPNLTRYWHPPQALRIAALFYRNQLDPLSAARLTRLPLAEIASFISAASALRLLRFPETADVVGDLPTASGRQGLLQRIMKRLRRG